MNESRVPPIPGPRPRPPAGGRRPPAKPPAKGSGRPPAKGGAGPALIGQLLEDVDYAGPVNQATLQAFAPITAAAGKPGSARWRLATELTIDALKAGGSPPAPSDLDRAWSERVSAMRERVVAFLTAAGHGTEVTPAVVESYSAVVAAAGEPGTPQWKAAVRIVANAPGKRPPADSKVGSEIARAVREDEARAEQRREQVREAARNGVDAARAYVREVRESTGAGPTWHELARHLGVKSKLGEDVVRDLHELGALTSTAEPRSLDVAD